MLLKKGQATALFPNINDRPPGADFATSWGNAVPQIGAFAPFFGAPNPRYGSVAGDTYSKPASDYIGSNCRERLLMLLGG